MTLALDHLVVGAATLEQGASWCEALLGVAPGPGGRHALMGTHNRLLAVGSAKFPRAYLEIIAIDPQAPAPARPRWFDLDDPALRDAIGREPRLIHWVARCTGIDAVCAAWRAAGIERGAVVEAQRDTPRGLLRWKISVRDDGRRLFDGTLPTLIEWGAVHPSDAMQASGVQLDALVLAGVPDPVRAALESPVTVNRAATAPIEAGLATPRGHVTLASWRA